MSQINFAQLVNTKIMTAAATNLVTVPAGHTYIVKNAYLIHNESAAAGSGAKTFNFEVSDTSGTNFKRITEDFITQAAGPQNWLVNLAPLNVEPSVPNGLSPATNTAKMFSSMLNLVLKGGQILRMNSSGGYDGADNTDIFINGLDDTE